MDAYKGLNNATNVFRPVGINDYKERVSYDPNGNIKTYLRNGAVLGGSPLAMDNLNYRYLPGTNQLDHVDDNVSATNYSIDIDDQDTLNYTYDQIGNLTKDVAEGITNISWTVYGKISSISKSDGTNIQYTYDASGNRISKKVNDKETWYLRDASGNVMSIYSKDVTVNNNHLTQSEIHLYGSSRLGVYNLSNDVENPAPVQTITFMRGKKFFELSNHLGNVLAIVSDKRFGMDSNSDGVIDYYHAEIVSANDYYPFGMMMPGRKYSVANTQYRYGFNGKELDKEVAATTTYDYGFRIYSPALGRFLSVDPLAKSYPWYTPYQFAGNKPINSIDVDGLEDHNVVTNEVDNTLTSSGADHKPANDPVAYGSNITPWLDLLNFKAPLNVWQKTKSRIGTQLIPFATPNQIQTIESGNSDQVNFDYYAVKITALPKSIKDGEKLFEFIRSNLGNFVDDKTTFGAYNSQERQRWNSQNPVGSVLSFDAKFTGLKLNLDDASVMTSSFYKGNGGGYWTFTTLSTRGDGEHPIAGTRQFGLVDNSDGTYTFYTRGTDRGYGVATVVAGAETIFKSAEVTWSAVMSNVFTAINSMGGNALIPSTPISKRVDWEEVKKLKK